MKPSKGITVRDFVENNRIAQDTYFNNATDVYLYNLGFEPSARLV